MNDTKRQWGIRQEQELMEADPYTLVLKLKDVTFFKGETEGWICPRCQTVNNPSNRICEGCSVKEKPSMRYADKAFGND